MNPLVNEIHEHGPAPVDIYYKLASHRVLFISDYIDDKLAVDIIATLMLLDMEDPFEKISLYINSDGGDIRSVFAIYDMLQKIEAPLETICVGSAMNEALLLLVGGSDGLRQATPNSLICASQLIQEKYAYADLKSAKDSLDRIQKDNKDFVAAIAKHVDKTTSEVMSDFERKKFMTAKQAKSYGLIDSIIGEK